MIQIKIDVLEFLKNAGYNTNRIRKEKLFGESTLQKFRKNGYPSENELNKLCTLLHLQPGDILEYIPDAPGDSTDE